MRSLISSTAELVGILLVAVGLWLLAPWLGLVAGGLGLIGLGVLLGLSDTASQDGAGE